MSGIQTVEVVSEGDCLKQKFDVIVVGAGIGGLTCACGLALAGKKVLVLEKNGFIGGRCASYSKEGFIIDYGIHVFSLGERGPLQEVVWDAQSKYKFDKPLLSWFRFPISMKFKESILRPRLPISYSHFWNLFPTLWNALRMKDTKWRDKLGLVRTMFGLLILRAKSQKPLESITVQAMLRRLSKSEVAQLIIASSADCVSGIPHYQFMARDYMDIMFDILENGGIWYPKGGCGAISRAYKNIIEKCGSIIVTSQCVEDLIIEDSDPPNPSPTIVGVKLKNSHRELHAPLVVVNVHFKEFYEIMLKRQYFPTPIANKILSLETALSAIVLHIALDSVVFQEKFIMESPMLLDKSFQKNIEDKVIGGMFVVASNFDPDLAPPGKQLVIAALGIDPVLLQNKDFLIRILLEKLQTFAPPGKQIKDHIEWMDVFGPQEIDSLFGEKGAIIGLASTVAQARSNRLASRTPVKGLYHCGDDSGLNLWGVGTELAARSGNECARLILAEESNIDVRINQSKVKNDNYTY